MRLTFDILFYELGKQFGVKSIEVFRPYSFSRNESSFKRVLLYSAVEPVFKSDYVYVGKADDLMLAFAPGAADTAKANASQTSVSTTAVSSGPEASSAPAQAPGPKTSIIDVPVIERNSCVICLGEAIPSEFRRSRCPCVLVNSTISVGDLLNRVQMVFDKYETWDEQLRSLQANLATVGDILNESFRIIENPMIVLDRGFHFLAYSNVIDERADLALYRPDENGNMRLDYIDQCINSGSIEYTRRDPFFVTHEGVTHVSVNLFDGEEFIGNLTVPFVLRPYAQGDLEIVLHLAGFVVEAIRMRGNIESGRSHALKSVLHELLMGMPASLPKRRFLDAELGEGARCVCVKMVLSGQNKNTVPTQYTCNAFESLLAGSVAFLYDASIVAFVELSAAGLALSEVNKAIADFAYQMQLEAGVSDTFSDLSQARGYYRQACVAIEVGSLFRAPSPSYQFHDYALQYMIMHSTGEFSPEQMYPEGVQKLMRHDVESKGKAGYLETLKAYLDNNMNLSKAADQLYVHKSSLLARMKRIRAILDMDLEDPDVQLRLRMSLKLIELSQSSAVRQSVSSEMSSRSSGNVTFKVDYM